MEHTEDPRAGAELLDAIKHAATLPWQLNLSTPSAAVALPGGAWEIQRTREHGWSVLHNAKQAGRCATALEALVYVLTRTAEHLAVQQDRIRGPLSAATAQLLPPPAPQLPAISEIRREPQGARGTTPPAAPSTLTPDATQTRALDRQLARYEALLDETTLNPAERLALRDQICRKRHVPDLPHLLPSVLQDICDWLQRQPPGDPRTASIRLQLAAKKGA